MLFFLDPPRLLVESIRAMLATVLAAISAFQQVLFGKDNEAFLGVVKVLGVQFGSTEIIVHLVHVCKVNKNASLGFEESRK